VSVREGGRAVPWELTVVKFRGSPPASYWTDPVPAVFPLGTAGEIRGFLAELLPGLAWQEVAPLIDQIRSSPGHPLEDQVAAWTGNIRERSSRSTFEARHEQDGVTLEFHGCDHGELAEFDIWVRGVGNPLPILADLCSPRGWSLVDGTSGQVLSGDEIQSATGWDEFRAYQQRVVET
jgi:hypothetical protein